MNIKRFICLALALTVMFCLCACANTQKPESDGEVPTKVESVQQATAPVTEEPTEETTEAPAEPTYVVTVVDEENNPVVGAWVQLCLEACVPAVTDENGNANFFLEEADYKVAFPTIPAGYELIDDVEQWYFADGENTMTIVIRKTA